MIKIVVIKNMFIQEIKNTLKEILLKNQKVDKERGKVRKVRKMATQQKMNFQLR